MKQVFRALLRARKAFRATPRHLRAELQYGESVGPGAPWLQLRLVVVAVVGAGTAVLLGGVESIPPEVHKTLLDGVIVATCSWVGVDAVRSCRRLGILPRSRKPRLPKRPPYG